MSVSRPGYIKDGPYKEYRKVDGYIYEEDEVGDYGKYCLG